MKYEPLYDRIIVSRLEAPASTPGGILLPDTAKEKPTRGRVLAVGPGEWQEGYEARAPMSVSVGDVVLFSHYAGTELPEEDGILFMRECDILAIVK